MYGKKNISFSELYHLLYCCIEAKVIVIPVRLERILKMKEWVLEWITVGSSLEGLSRSKSMSSLLVGKIQ